MRKMFATIGIVGCVMALASCSQPQDASVDVQGTVDLETITVDERVPESHFVVVDENGQAVELKLEDGPVLFVAHWCPHCGEYLKTHEPLPDVRVVAVYPMEGETLGDMMKNVRRKLDQAGWEDVPLYGTMEPDIVEGVPVIAYKSREDVFFRNPFEIGEGERR
jgi:hypothetical protein